jgi:hypothetical protein
MISFALWCRNPFCVLKKKISVEVRSAFGWFGHGLKARKKTGSLRVRYNEFVTDLKNLGINLTSLPNK